MCGKKKKKKKKKKTPCQITIQNYTQFKLLYKTTQKNIFKLKLL